MHDLLSLILLTLTFGSSVLAVLQARAARSGKAEAAKHLAAAQSLVTLAEALIRTMGKAGSEAAPGPSPSPGPSQPTLPTTPPAQPGETQASSSDRSPPTSDRRSQP